jgi:hypothetical protein
VPRPAHEQATSPGAGGACDRLLRPACRGLGEEALMTEARDPTQGRGDKGRRGGGEFDRIQSDARLRLSFERTEPSNLWIQQEVLGRGQTIEAQHQKIEIERETVMVFADDAPLATWSIRRIPSSPSTCRSSGTTRRSSGRSTGPGGSGTGSSRATATRSSSRGRRTTATRTTSSSSTASSSTTTGGTRTRSTSSTTTAPSTTRARPTLSSAGRATARRTR